MTSFTVAIPTHNRRETALLAALSAVRQSRPPKEVLVLCDGCTDGTSEAIAALGDRRIRALDLPKGDGYAYAHRNVAIEEGRGEVVTWLADDDLFLPDHFKRIGRLWDSGAFDVVVAPAVIVHEDDRLEWIGRDWRIPQHRTVMFEQTNTSVMASVSVRRDLARDVGGWDGSIGRAADWDLWKRVLDFGARPGMTHEASVLHFRATTRRQAWSLRVRQNTAWFEGLDDPQRREALRDELRLARSAFEGELSRLLDHATAAYGAEHRRAEEQSRTIGEVTERFHGSDRLRQVRDARIVELTLGQAESARELAAAQAELAVVRGDLAATNARLEAALAERAAVEPLIIAGARDRETLQRIYAGGWWRLRGVLRAALSPVRTAKTAVEATPRGRRLRS